MHTSEQFLEYNVESSILNEQLIQEGVLLNKINDGLTILLNKMNKADSKLNEFMKSKGFGPNEDMKSIIIKAVSRLHFAFKSGKDNAIRDALIIEFKEFLKYLKSYISINGLIKLGVTAVLVFCTIKTQAFFLKVFTSLLKLLIKQNVMNPKILLFLMNVILVGIFFPVTVEVFRYISTKFGMGKEFSLAMGIIEIKNIFKAKFNRIILKILAGLQAIHTILKHQMSHSRQAAYEVKDKGFEGLLQVAKRNVITELIKIFATLLISMVVTLYQKL